MLEKIWKAAATRRARSRGRLTWRAGRAVAIAAFLILTGCTAAPRIVAQGDPSDPGALVRAVTYRSTLGPYQSGRPVDPAPWGAQNQRVTPQSKSE